MSVTETEIPAAPRRVRHLIVIPGGENPDGAGAAPVQGQLAVEALPLEASPSPFKVKLRVISQAVSASRQPGLPFVVLASTLISLAILGLVILHVMVDQYSFKVDALQTKVNTQQSALGQLRYQVSVSEAPQRVAAAAAQLGLGPASVVKVVGAPGSGVPLAGSTPVSSTAAAKPATGTTTTKPATTRPAPTAPAETVKPATTTAKPPATSGRVTGTVTATSPSPPQPTSSSPSQPTR